MAETLTNINKLRNPNYLGGWDLQDASGKTVDIIVTIKEIKRSEVFNQKSGAMELELTVHFMEVKPIILNATNRKTLIKATETEFIEQMVGKKIQLTTQRGKWFGEFHDAIRIVNKKSSQLMASTAPKPVNEADCIARLEKADTVAILAEIWQALAPAEKANVSVLAKKEEMKQKLNNTDANIS
jgi:hypothetical protein